MKNVLVTGASGFIGSNLVVELIKRGYIVHAFHRKNSNRLTLKDVNVKHIVGDILDANSLHNAFKGCDTVFHTAALVSFWKGDRNKQYKINVEGTRNVIEACIEARVNKLVHISTIAALGYRTDGQLIDEKTKYNWGPQHSYRYTKYLAELEMLKGIEKGLNTTIVNPSIVIGPRDINAHGGIIVRGIKHGQFPAYVEGGINLVSVHDVVKGAIAAVDLGCCGERYILGGVNLTIKEVFELTAKVVCGKAPRIKVPNWLVKFTAKGFDLFGYLTGLKLGLTSDLVAAAGLYNWYSIEKAQKELGYKPTSIEKAIREAYEWYVEHKMI